jgi:hypothetical protein
MAEHIAQRAGEHAHLAMESDHAAERLSALGLGVRFVLDHAPAVAILDHEGQRRKGASASDSTVGPEPGPPPPWGVEKVLCKLMCMASTPRSPGRTRPKWR